MTKQMTMTATAAHHPSMLRSMIDRFVQRRARYTAYRTTLSELNALSDRELSDLGLNRSMLHSVARESAQQG